MRFAASRKAGPDSPMTIADQPSRIDLSTAAARINAAQRPVITTHARADGDAIGCVAGLRRVLTQQGKSAEGYLHEPVLQRYRFLAETRELRVWDSDRAAQILDRADLLVLVDTCATSQLGEIADALRESETHKIAIDHHVTHDPIVDELMSDERAGSCAQIIARLCDEAGWPLDAEAAALFYMGLAADTGWFRFSNADAAAFAAAARLIEAGAKPSDLFERLYQSDPEPRIRLVGSVLSSFELLADGRLAVIRITNEMLEACGATHQMTEEIINEPQRLGSVIACVLLVEPEGDGPVRVSFRSKYGVDVAAAARSFGGGGHHRAAGAKIPGTLEEVCRQIVPTMIRAVESIGQEAE